MSFIPFEKKDLPKELKNISNTFIRCNTNILRQITIGHESFYKKIKLSIKDTKGKVTIIKPESDPSTHFLQLHLLEQQQQSVSTSIKNEDIKFTNYLFDNRYQFNTLLTYGGFSQIILVNDYFSQDKQMVLKVLKSGYHSMGVREQVILRHLTVHQTKGPQYCKFDYLLWYFYISYTFIIFVSM